MIWSSPVTLIRKFLSDEFYQCRSTSILDVAVVWEIRDCARDLVQRFAAGFTANLLS